jgi:hypothetical protein
MGLYLPDGCFSLHVEEAMRRAIRRLAEDLLQPTTWDKGKERHRDARFTIDTSIQVYFCDDHSLGNGFRARRRTGSFADTCRWHHALESTVRRILLQASTTGPGRGSLMVAISGEAR